MSRPADLSRGSTPSRLDLLRKFRCLGLGEIRIILHSVAIVVSYNTCQTTLRCLQSVTAEPDVDVWLVDNGSIDGSADAVAAAFPAVHLIRSGTNLGFAGANNLAIRQSGGDRVLLLNSDAFPRPGAVAALHRYLDEHPQAAAVGPRLLNADGSRQPSCFKFPGPVRSVFDFLLLTAAMPNQRIVGDYRAWPHDRDRTVDFVTGACLLIRRSALDAVGLLDESFFFYFEEADWCLRATRAGWTIGFTPAAEVVHEGGGSGKAEPDRVFNEFQRGHERFIRKHYGRAAVGIHRVTLGLGAVIRLAVFGTLRLLGRGDSATVRKWWRILLWTLGRRGPGLRG
jgi:N-acetylglucosaminyl-diphospho-decaprenol L-rhamnosyltransferase